ncbi:hemolysin-type calcium-binding repeat 2 copies family protein [Asticcacaulis biprosthecium C19]|uniref:Hemolysin-type calcium-binding repeat 2 copies family protein n=1 Tax=Asticcacaulis biprosthecium C19 TaxID=715226 RepID=F4QGK1_9CAUL|nr:cadherin-like domain-containing protein [Asticcacaulis biprosthecium]EGF93682.1 hemolysin-type calcium-binding repeat 2 copies family protein [Asticcacaulis biprosthecium C19]
MADFTVEPVDTVNTTTAGTQRAPEITGLDGGGYVVTWYGNTADLGTVLYAQVYGADGDKLGGEVVVADHLPVTGADVAARADGGFVVIYTEAGSAFGIAGDPPVIAGRHFDATGAATSAAYAISQAPTLDQINPDIARLADGGFMVTWSGQQQASSSDHNLHGQKLNLYGQRVGDMQYVAANLSYQGWAPNPTAGDSGTSVIARSDGGWIVGWMTGRSASTAFLTLQAYNASGAPVGVAVEVKPGTYPVSSFDADISVLDDLTVAFNSQSRVFIADLSTGAVTSFDSNVSANTGLLADIQGLPDGSLLVTWTEVDGAAGLLKAAIYDRAGVVLSDIVTVTAAGNNRYATATMLSDGNVALAWTDTVSSDIETTIILRNHGPELTGEPVVLPGATEDTVYTLSTADLLAGYTDTDGDSLSVKSLTLEGGTLVNNGDGTYSWTPPANYFGPIGLSYKISDGQGANLIVTRSFEVARVTDTIFNSNSTRLDQYSENLTLTGRGNIKGVGNSWDNVLTGNSGINTLEGQLGNDTYYVQNSEDHIVEYRNGGVDLVYASVDYSLAGGDTEYLFLTGTADLNGRGNASANTLAGNGGANRLSGDRGHDRLNGGAGADTLIGATGNDTYVVDNVGDSVSDVDENFFSGGTDVVEASVSWTLGTDLEQLVLTGAAAIDGTGNGLSNVLTGNDARNVLTGGLGNDTYYIQNETDRVVELHFEGEDTVISSVSYSLFGRAVETLLLTGTGNLNGTGNSLNNTLTGTDGNNVLDGGTGGDLMSGGLGNDTYYVDNFYDNVAELHLQGNDTVYASVTYSFFGRAAEVLILTGAGNINGTGNSLVNTLIGNSGANVLDGAGGNDNLTGGAGADVFLFSAGSRADTVTDFNAADNDSLNVNAYTGGVANAGLVSQTGNHVVINLGGGNVVTVLNASQAEILAHMVW